MNNTHKSYPLRHLARVTVEAVTPVAVGSGEKDVITDALVMRDVNGLPYLPATSIAGVLRHAVGQHGSESTLWGFQNGAAGHGSRIAFTNANIVAGDGTTVDGLADSTADPLLRRYSLLPVRQHVRIGHDGSAEMHGKFDNEVVFAGSRFTFETEMAYDDDSSDEAHDAIAALERALAADTLRIGGDTHSGLGLLRVVSLKQAHLDLRRAGDLNRYLGKPASLSDDDFWRDMPEQALATRADEAWTRYELTLTPDYTFSFGSGFSDDFLDVDASDDNKRGADDTPATESIVEWRNGNGALGERRLLIPASSVKGALSHRVAYHYNCIKGIFADRADNAAAADNAAVRALFGSIDGSTEAGRVMLSDVFDDKAYCETTDAAMLNHVQLDQFTGGAVDGALYNEKVSYRPAMRLTLTLWARNDALADLEVRRALECALTDLTTGMLPLGGHVNRGHGVFTGQWTNTNNTQQ